MTIDKTSIYYLNKMDRDLFWGNALKSLSQENFIKELRNNRRKGRNDYPVDLLWKYVLKTIAYKLPSFASLYRSTCDQLPPPWAFSRFIGSILPLSHTLDTMLLAVSEVGPIIGLGFFLEQGERIHFLFDANTGLPFLWDSGPSEESCLDQAERILKKNPHIHCQYFLASMEYASLSEVIWNQFHLKPIIPSALSINEKRSYQGINYDTKGQLYCPNTHMIYVGFEESRNTLKFRCAANHYGYRCAIYDTCPLRKGLRVPLKADNQVFTPLPRFSYRWEKLYSLYSKLPEIKKILISSIPAVCKKSLFLQLASLLFSAAYRTQKRSNRAPSLLKKTGSKIG